MRAAGVVDSARGLIPFGHLGWSYQDRAEFRVRAAEYLADGLAAGQRVEYVGDGPVTALEAELRALPGLGLALDEGRLGASSLSEFYEFTDEPGVIDPYRSAAAQVSATKNAVEHGYTGLRGVVDATAVTLTPAARAAFARFEYLIDQQMHVRPVSALCAFDAARLGVAARELACLHPFTSNGVPFRVYAEHDAAFALAGEIDIASHDLFATTIARIVPLSAGSDIVIDARALTFIDHRALIMLNDCVRAHHTHATLLVDNAQQVTLVHMLNLRNMHVERVSS